MMRFDNTNMAEIRQYFPDLNVVAGEICGEIDFFSKYVQNHRGQWVIESCESEMGSCVHGNYKIRVIPNSLGVPLVFETRKKYNH